MGMPIEIEIFVIFTILIIIIFKIKSLNNTNKETNSEHSVINKEKINNQNIDKLLKKQATQNSNQKSKKSENNTQAIKKKEFQPLNVNDKLLKYYDIQYIYHMTHVNNLQNILNYGLLPHGNNNVNNKIDNPEVNSRRNFIEPIYNKNVHNYVPFYFNPKNAMLYVNKENQGDLVILVFDNNLIYEQGSLFTDGNASVNSTVFYNNINDLDKLAWDCIHAKTWFNFNDGKRTKMSEVLVPNKVGVNKLKKIYCINYHIKNYIDNLMLNYPDIKVEVNTEIFF